MDQIKIGQFIANCRKEKNLTQSQLAEKLFITDRAVSKWERGKGLPDSSIMLNLCNILEISVNELLSGEKVEIENYHKIAEENFIKMKQSEEKIEKTMKLIQTLLTFLCLFFSLLTIGIFVIHLTMNYFYPESYDGILFNTMLPFSILLAFLFSCTSLFLSFRERFEIRAKSN